MPTPNSFTAPTQKEIVNPNAVTTHKPSPLEVTADLAVAATKFVIPSTKAAVIETASLHWLDTIAKRAQTHKGKIFSDNKTLLEVKKVFLRDAVGKGFSPAMGSLYSGLGFGTVYKIGQRNLKFIGQKPLQLMMENHVTSSKWLSNALAGSTMGGIEAITFTWLDSLKIKLQTDESYKKRIVTQYESKGVLGSMGSVFGIIREEKLHKKGLGATLCRNVPGSFSLFGVPVLIKEKIYTWKPLQEQFGWKDGQLSFFQLSAANYAGSVASIVVPAPVDLTKTRQQAMSTPSQLIPLAKEIYAKEGWKAFYKGSGIKLCTLGVKQAFFMTLFDHFSKVSVSPSLPNFPRLPKEVSITNPDENSVSSVSASEMKDKSDPSKQLTSQPNRFSGFFKKTSPQLPHTIKESDEKKNDFTKSFVGPQ